MKKLYPLVILSLLFTTGYGQQHHLPFDSSLTTRARLIFNYLLKTSRLNISQQDHITVRDLINDANAAGYGIDTMGCMSLRSNMDKFFYTLTPQLIRLPGLIVAPKDSSYVAMMGNVKLTFSSTGSFEQKLNWFFAKPYKTADTIEYTLTPLVTNYSRFIIKHYADADNFDWIVNYTDTSGINRTAWLHSADTAFEVFATTINAVQDVDTVNHVVSGSWIDITAHTDTSYRINPSTYYRPTAAFLTIEVLVGKPATETGFSVLVMGNPSTSQFNLAIRSNDQQSLLVRLSDVNGRTVETVKAIPNSEVVLGRNVNKGVYYAELVRGNERKTIKLLKI